MGTFLRILAIVGIICTFQEGINGTISGCNPTTECKDHTIQGIKVPDPEDCTKFYYCIGDPPFMYPTDSSFPCDSGYYFDYSQFDCVPDNGDTCTNPCDLGLNTSCKKNCTDVELFVGDQNDCTIYYACTPTTPIKLHCSGINLYFDGTVCQSNILLCCDMCEAVCDGDLFIQIADPYDCTKFYICMESGVITNNENYHTSCSEGQHFDEESANCVIGGECTNYCTKQT